MKAYIPNMQDVDSTRIDDFSVNYQGELLKSDLTNDLAVVDIKMARWAYQRDGHITTSVTRVHGHPKECKLSIAELQIDQPRLRDPVSVIGFPSLMEDEIGMTAPVLSTGVISMALSSDSKTKKFYYLAELHSMHGNSGGPAFSGSSGKVMGVVTRYKPDTDGNNRVKQSSFPLDTSRIY